MADHKDRIDALAGMMQEFGLAEANWEDEGFRIAFKRNRTVAVAPVASDVPLSHAVEAHYEEEADEVPIAAVPAGMPITSPMNGIFYTSPSPSAPPFVKEGDTVAVGQVVGLIEAMKVFNEITSNFAGTVKKVAVDSGAIVQPGDTLLIIG